MNNYILSHIPVHPDAKGRFAGNIHGHTHSNNIMMQKHAGAALEIDPWYQCVCVEQTDFRPILFEEVLKRIKGL
jgi:calcineurin-like phosphoesterase family protein